MRQKAEQRIREAVAELGLEPPYRIGQVRQRTGLIRKVFDKTILDMARLGTIHLFEGIITGMSESDMNNLLFHGETAYASFLFLESGITPQYAIDTVDVMIKEINADEWAQFEYLTQKNEDKTGVQKIRDMIRRYIQDTQFCSL
jgi:hypothetical protein